MASEPDFAGTVVRVRALDAEGQPRRGWRFVWPDAYGEPISAVDVTLNGETYRLEIPHGDR